MSHNGKPKIAFFDFTGCEGCQLTVVDCLQDHLELLEVVEIVAFREAMTGAQDTYEIAFVEGSYSRPGDKARLSAIRKQAQIVIALGACAHLGGVNAGRNRLPPGKASRYVYGAADNEHGTAQALPISAVIEVDGVIPGCPIDRQEFISSVKRLLQGRLPKPPTYPVCVECKLRENACLFTNGQICLGSVTRAGCHAICPSLGIGCEGCRGLIENANIDWLYAAAREHGHRSDEVDAALSLFLSNELVDGRIGSHGNR
jgi:sulfhydrogenase subunit delta